VPSWAKPRRGAHETLSVIPLTLDPEDFVSARRVDNRYLAVELNDLRLEVKRGLQRPPS
jgi:hypothetical protein